jgi:hypothetical protein
MRLVLCHSGLTGCDTVLSGIVLFTVDVFHPEVFLKYIGYVSVKTQQCDVRNINIPYYIRRATCFDCAESWDNCMQLSPKTASVVPPEDGRLTPETCRGLRHNKVLVKVKVY